MEGGERQNVSLDGVTKESNCTNTKGIDTPLYEFSSLTVVERLPIELVFYILSRLPIEDIIRYTTVRKGWCALTKNPHFIQRHLSRALSLNHRILLEPTTKGPITSLYLIGKDGGMWKRREIPVENISGKYMFTLSSCHGLLCVASADCKDDSCWDRPSSCSAVRINSGADPLFIYNPITRECKELPRSDYKPEKAHISVGFGFDPRSNKYKVVRIFREYSTDNPQISIRGQIITLGEDSWREVEVSHAVNGCRNEKPILLDGALHWRISLKNNPGPALEQILVLDLYNETFRTINFPSSISQSLTGALPVFFFSSGVSLYLVQQDNFDSFRMWRIERANTKKGYKFYESSFSVDTGIQDAICSIHMKDKLIDNSFLFHVITRMNLRKRKPENDHLSLYSPETKEYKVLEISGIPEFFEVNLFIPTLVSPDDAFGKGAQEGDLSLSPICFHW